MVVDQSEQQHNHNNHPMRRRNNNKNNSTTTTTTSSQKKQNSSSKRLDRMTMVQMIPRTIVSSWRSIILLVCLFHNCGLLCFWSSSSSSSYYVVEGRAILGIDLGSSYMKVALVRPGSPLEIVTNLHSKRKTEQLILFDNGGQRFYGADAAALLARKSSQTAAHVTLALGRDDTHVVAQVLPDHHHPIVPLYNETRYGLSLAIVTDAKKNTYKSENFTPEELTAMVLSHAQEIAVKYAAEAGGKELKTIKDCVITVPSFLTDAERRSYLDAATLAGLNVLVLMDETVAAAVQYAMDKTFADGPVTMLFYNMGAVSTQVAIVKFEAVGETSSKKIPVVTVLAKAWDETLGGAAFDHVIMEYIVNLYNAKRTDGWDVRTDRAAMTKLRIEANKIKHVLSANNEQPIRFDHDDVSVNTVLSRRQYEELCHDLLHTRVSAPVTAALARANLTTVDAVELLGGGTRVPAVTERLAATVLPPPLDLGKHMNGDEAMALGSAFVGANHSTAFRVRKIGLVDLHPYGVNVHIHNLAGDDAAAAADAAVAEDATAKTDESAATISAAAAWSKSTTIFKPWGKTGVKKSIAFSHDQNVQVELLYEDGTSLERYNITGIDTFAESKKEIGKPKVSLSFELGTSGITRLIKAEAIVEELYTVEEEIEVEDLDDSTSTNSTDGTANATTDGASGTDTATKDDDGAATSSNEESTTDKTPKVNVTDTSANATNATAAANATKADAAPKKKMKKVTVEKEKKRVHKQPLIIERYYVGRIQPHSPTLLAESKRKLEEMDRVDRERIQLEESRNQVESFIYKLKNELVDRAEEIEKVTNEKQRKDLAKLSAEAEEWWDDVGYKSDRATAEDKYAELYNPYQKIQLRITESTARPEAMEKLRKKLEDVEKLMEKWTETKPQVTPEERKGVLDQVKKIQKWADDNEKKQDKKKPHEDPVFLSTDIPDQFVPLERTVVKLGKKAKPKSEKKAANATDGDSSSNSTTTDSNTTSSDSNSPTPAANSTDDQTDNGSAPASEEKATSGDESTTEGKADAEAASKEEETPSDDDLNKEAIKEEL